LLSMTSERGQSGARPPHSKEERTLRLICGRRLFHFLERSQQIIDMHASSVENTAVSNTTCDERAQSDVVLNLTVGLRV